MDEDLEPAESAPGDKAEAEEAHLQQVKEAQEASPEKQKSSAPSPVEEEADKENSAEGETVQPMDVEIGSTDEEEGKQQEAQLDVNIEEDHFATVINSKPYEKSSLIDEEDDTAEPMVA